jgi:hypothetical protein
MYEIIENIYGDIIIKRTNNDGTISYIPTTDARNSDYQSYLSWLEGEN